MAAVADAVSRVGAAVVALTGAGCGLGAGRGGGLLNESLGWRR